jgi:isochorismate hydrolase
VLKNKEITSVFITGLALDFCVYYTAVDAQKLGYQTYVVLDATRGFTSFLPEIPIRSSSFINQSTEIKHIVNISDIDFKQFVISTISFATIVCFASY